MTLRVIEGGEVYLRVGWRSIVRHTRADCPRLAASRTVAETREVDLWPGFICKWCRAHPAAEEDEDMTAPNAERCWLCNDRPIRDDAPGVGALGSEQEARRLIYCHPCATTLRAALAPRPA